MKGFEIKEELYTSLGHRSMACTLILENGYELTGTHCIDMADLINGETMKKKAFESAYHLYLQLQNAFERQMIYGNTRIGGETFDQKESV